jgi:hypothetical protein
VAAWSNGTAAVALAAGAFVLTVSWAVAVTVLVVGYIGLRLALTTRWTLWIAAAAGTLAVAGCAGLVAWLFGHLVEVPGAASIALVLAALGASTVPAWAYGTLAQRRAARIRDSLWDCDTLSSSR